MQMLEQQKLGACMWEILPLFGGVRLYWNYTKVHELR
jgi:hypothetical protein